MTIRATFWSSTNLGEVWLLCPAHTPSIPCADRLFQVTGDVPDRARLSSAFFGEESGDPERQLAPYLPSPAVSSQHPPPSIWLLQLEPQPSLPPESLAPAPLRRAPASLALGSSPVIAPSAQRNTLAGEVSFCFFPTHSGSQLAEMDHPTPKVLPSRSRGPSLGPWTLEAGRVRFSVPPSIR